MIRLQLIAPNMKVLNPDLYNEMFTAHGVTMVFLAIMPMGIGFANYMIPLANRCEGPGLSQTQCVWLLGLPVRRADVSLRLDFWQLTRRRLVRLRAL